MKKRAMLSAVLLSASTIAGAPKEVSGIYPGLAMFNGEGECGTGAVVPWAGSLWVVTYAPHAPYGSSDKLYEIRPDLRQIVREESVGGTPANRMIHEESGQLLIGPYLIDRDAQVRVISPRDMPGRLTANARHLADPAGKVDPRDTVLPQPIRQLHTSSLADQNIKCHFNRSEMKSHLRDRPER